MQLQVTDMTGFETGCWVIIRMKPGWSLPLPHGYNRSGNTFTGKFRGLVHRDNEVESLCLDVSRLCPGTHALRDRAWNVSPLGFQSLERIMPLTGSETI
jgi:hypothetical protein